MDLLCVESQFEPQAIFDAAIVDDDRLLSNLIFIEEHYLITGSYFKCLQTDLTPNNRFELATWMLEVCEAENCQREVFPLAMNILDRFLALVKLKKSQLQLLGSVCLFIATKLRQSKSISPRKLVYYTDWSITSEELVYWEMLVLNQLKWNVSAVTPNDFIGPLLRRISKCSVIDEHQNRIKKHILNMIDLCALDFNFSLYPSSMIAAASIITAIDGLMALTKDHYHYRSISNQVLYQLHELTGIEKELLTECHLQIEQKILLAMENQSLEQQVQQQKKTQQHQENQHPTDQNGGTAIQTNLPANSTTDKLIMLDDCSKENYSKTINLNINEHCRLMQKNAVYNNVGKYSTSCPMPNDTSIGVELV